MGAISTALTTAAAVGKAVSGFQQAETARKAQEAQSKAVKEEQRIQKEEIAEQKETALTQRKALIDKKRRQLYGSGDTQPTAQSLTPSSSQLTVPVLG